MLQNIGERVEGGASVKNTGLTDAKTAFSNQQSCSEAEREIWWERVPMSSHWQPPCSCGIYITDLF